MIKKVLSYSAIGMTLILPAQATDLQKISDTLKKQYPSTVFENIRHTPVSGLTEVKMGKNIVYVSENGRYFFFGSLYDMKTQTDLTAIEREKAQKVNFDTLPLHDAVKIVKGNGERVFALFSDPDCPFCKRIEETLEKVTNYTVYIFMMPIPSLHPDAVSKSENFWCQQEPGKAWKEWMLNNVLPLDKRPCPNPIERNMSLGRDMGINGTPFMIHQDGRVIAGAVPFEKLDIWLAEGKTP